MKALARRLWAWLLLLLAVHAVTFLALRAARGGPFDEDRAFAPEVQAALRQRYHLDEPLHRQYLRSLAGLLRGDFGPSLRYRDLDVGAILAQALPVSLALGGGGLALAVLLGVPAGLWAALRRRAAPAVETAATLLLALPNFVLAGLAIALFSFALGWLPPAGHGGPRHLILPCLCLGLPYAAQVARLCRAAAAVVLDSPAWTCARAKGLPEGLLLRRHALRPALLPVIAFLGPAAAGLLTGSLVIEQVFALPGLGAHFVQAALNRDYTLALGATLIYTALLGGLSLLSDWLLQALDPRAEALE